MTPNAAGPVASVTPRHPRPGPAQWFGQLVLYGLFAAFIGVFSHWPTYHPIDANQALVKVSVARLGQPVGECRRLSEAELAELPPNMRDPVRCPRERSPLTMQVHVDDALVLERVAQPGGLSRDGPAAIYERLLVPAGEHRISVRFNDDIRPGAPTHARDAVVTLQAGQVLVIDFDAEEGGIVLR